MWKWLNRMLDEMRVSSNVDSLPAGIELPVLRREVEVMANTIEKLGFSVVLSHGDLKFSCCFRANCSKEFNIEELNVKQLHNI